MAQKQGFFKGMTSELKKVVWPTKKQTINNTLMVLFVVAFFAIVVILFDLILTAGDSALWNFIISK